tara:strand:- start:39 stop:179 length:141 start_codon:yes stop_codon:yes gene_type:complete
MAKKKDAEKEVTEEEVVEEEEPTVVKEVAEASTPATSVNTSSNAYE